MAENFSNSDRAWLLSKAIVHTLLGYTLIFTATGYSVFLGDVAAVVTKNLGISFAVGLTALASAMAGRWWLTAKIAGLMFSESELVMLEKLRDEEE